MSKCVIEIVYKTTSIRPFVYAQIVYIREPVSDLEISPGIIRYSYFKISDHFTIWRKMGISYILYDYNGWF